MNGVGNHPFTLCTLSLVFSSPHSFPRAMDLEITDLSSSLPPAIAHFRGSPADRTRSFEVATPKELSIRAKPY